MVLVFSRSSPSPPGDLFVLVFSSESRETWEEVVRLRQQILDTKVRWTLDGIRNVDVLGWICFTLP